MSAPQPAPDAEIALKNSVASLTEARNKFAPRATSVAAPPSGLTKPPSGLTKPARNDVKKGRPVRIAGRGETEPPLEALHPLTPREKVPFLPPSQTQNGVTLQIIDAGWMSLAQMWPRGPEKSTRPLFFFAYDTLPRPRAPDVPKNQVGFGGPVVEPNTRLLQVSGPQGERVNLVSKGPLQRGGGNSGVTIGAFTGVHPQWKNVVAEFESLDPSAPPQAAGTFQSTLSFKNVPIVDKSGRSVPIGQEMKTARGTKIRLESLRFYPPSGTDKGDTFFVFAVTPPPNVADMQVVLGINSVKNQDGKLWKYRSWGSGGTQAYVEAAPRPGDTSMTVDLQVRESAPSLQNRRWLRRFRVEIPVASLLQFTPPPPRRPAPVSQAQGEAVTVEIEPETHGYEGNWEGIAWIKNRVPLADKTQRWLIRQAQAHAKGEKMVVWNYDRNYDQLFLRLNGSRAAPEEHSALLTVPFFKRPAQFDLKITLELAHRLEKFSQMRGVPLPAPGASLDIGAGQFKSDSLRVRRLFWFKNMSQLFGLPPRARDGFQTENLAVVVETTPVFPRATVDIPAFRVSDDAGRKINARPWVVRGDAGRAGTQNTNLHTLLLPVPASSKSLDLWFDTVEITWTGQSETLDVKNVTGW